MVQFEMIPKILNWFDLKPLIQSIYTEINQKIIKKMFSNNNFIKTNNKNY